HAGVDGDGSGHVSNFARVRLQPEAVISERSIRRHLHVDADNRVRRGDLLARQGRGIYSEIRRVDENARAFYFIDALTTEIDLHAFAWRQWQRDVRELSIDSNHSRIERQCLLRY